MIPVTNVRDFWRKRPWILFKYTEKVTETGKMIVFTVETNSKHVGLVH